MSRTYARTPTTDPQAVGPGHRVIPRGTTSPPAAVQRAQEAARAFGGTIRERLVDMAHRTPQQRRLVLGALRRGDLNWWLRLYGLPPLTEADLD